MTWMASQIALWASVIGASLFSKVEFYGVENYKSQRKLCRGIRR
jgi:hypothetical protein